MPSAVETGSMDSEYKVRRSFMESLRGRKETEEIMQLDSVTLICTYNDYTLVSDYITWIIKQDLEPN